MRERMGSLVVRVAVDGDVAAVVHLERGCATAPHWTEEEYWRIVQGEGKLRRGLWVAELAGEVVGFAVGMVAGEIGELENVAVSEAERGGGIGGALLMRVLDWCWREGAEQVRLEVRTGNERAIRLYQRAGFQEAGKRRRYYEDPVEDALLMTRVRDLPGANRNV